MKNPISIEKKYLQSLRKLGFILILISPSWQIQAQKYDIAAGLRLGTEWGVSYKHRVTDKGTLEGIMQQGFNQQTALASVLYEHHFKAGVRRLNFYAGGGPHMGWYVDEKLETIYDNPYGLSLISGAELTLGGVLVSWDIKPAINFSDANRGTYFHSGLSIRLVLKKRESRVGAYLKSDR
ncbi:MAG TPA: hypothetical protein VJ917_05390, partial [Saprospiraceae bacterium]|nr:hypothetical protein [Saprospiraceae bacterium]